MGDWFYLKSSVFGDSHQGPFADVAMFQFALDGKIKPETLVVHPSETQGQWIHARHVRSLMQRIEEGQRTRQEQAAIDAEVTPPPFAHQAPPVVRAPREDNHHDDDSHGATLRWITLGFVAVSLVSCLTLAVVVLNRPTTEARATRNRIASNEGKSASVSKTSERKAVPVEALPTVVTANPLPMPPPVSKLEPAELSVEEIFDLVSPNVALIEVFNEEGERIGHGSGVVIDPKLTAKLLGRDEHSASPTDTYYLLTNQHVIENAISLKVRVARETEPGQGVYVLLEDAGIDLALLQVHCTAKSAVGATLGTHSPRIGATVFAIGNPLGLTNTLSQGIVSGERELNNSKTWLQTTAAISPGSSGGALINTSGHVIGITTAARVSGQNLNFAIGIKNIRDFLAMPIDPHSVWEGKSIRKSESAEYDSLSWMIRQGKAFSNKTSPWTAGQVKAAKALEEAHELLSEAKASDSLVKCRSAIVDCPRELEYLLNYTIGEAHLALAFAVNIGKSVSVDQYRSNIRSSSHYVDAIEAYKQAVELKPDFLPSYSGLADLHSVASEEREAIAATKQLAQKMPKCAYAQWKYGQILDRFDRDAEAIEPLRAAIAINPKYHRAYYNLASAYSDIDEHELAAATYQAALELGGDTPDYILYFNLGGELQIQGKFEQAIAAYESARPGEPAAFRGDIDKRIAQCRAGQREYRPSRQSREQR